MRRMTRLCLWKGLREFVEVMRVRMRRRRVRNMAKNARLERPEMMAPGMTVSLLMPKELTLMSVTLAMTQTVVTARKKAAEE